MASSSAVKPAPTEYAEYYGKYVSLVPESDIVQAMKAEGVQTVELLRGLTEEQGNYAYAEGKWTIKELIGHINDTERIFAYRLLRFARNDSTPLEGFDQDPYVLASNYNALSLTDVVDEFAAIRQVTLATLKNLDAEAWTRAGIASDNSVTVRALAYIMLGHERHHVAILKEKYLSSASS
jgi:hypothetical protein